MKHLNVVILVSFLILLPLSAFGTSGVPSLELSTSSIAYSGPGVPTLLVLPDGSGLPFTEARDASGNPVDATITMHLREPGPYALPIVNFPKEDIWLEVDDDGLARCYGVGTGMDDNTDVNGMGRWTAPLKVGGYSDSVVRVMVNGSALTSNEGHAFRFNSPDIDGSFRVDLGDVTAFAIDYYSGYHFRSDFSSDGVIDLADVAILAQHIGAQCP